MKATSVAIPKDKYNHPMPPLLELRNLRVSFTIAGGAVAAVRDVSLAIAPGESLALVGESGSGKSATALAIMRLLPPSAAVRGEILLAGPLQNNAAGADPQQKAASSNLLQSSEAAMRSLRGRRIAMIFQEPMTALNPVMRVGDQVAEAVLAHAHVGTAALGRPSRAELGNARVSRADACQLAIEALREVQIPDADRRARDYPHQLSGGQRQRVMIAMALVNRPQLLIADEPTTALDVTVQAQILQLVAELRQKFSLAMLFISHDLAVVAQVADRVAVMLSGSVVELAPVREIFRAPQHPYTQGLLRSVPTLRTDRTQPLRPVEDAARLPATTPLLEVAPGHWARNPRQTGN